MESKPRLPVETFDLPIHKIRRGYYSAVYFWREKQILEKMGYDKKVLMQVFQKKKAVICGTDEAIAVLKLCSGHYQNQEEAFHCFNQLLKVNKELQRLNHLTKADTIPIHLPTIYRDTESSKKQIEFELNYLWQQTFDQLKVMSLRDGDKIRPWETVMTIIGLPQNFAHLESVYLGILARRTLVATNVRKVTEAAQGKPIFFFADRFDHFENQTGDGYAAVIGGAKAVATDSMGEWWGNQGSGTMPHALIACFNGDTVAATIAFAKAYPEVPCISLVDFKNDCVKTALEVAEAMKAEGLPFWGVRLDTSENMVDHSLPQHIYSQDGDLNKYKGVNPHLVNYVRDTLDQHGHQDVKIVVSGGFTAEKIEFFEKEKVAVDAYGCGNSLIVGSNPFTADIVMVDGYPCSKVGRYYRPNPRLELVK